VGFQGLTAAFRTLIGRIANPPLTALEVRGWPQPAAVAFGGNLATTSCHASAPLPRLEV